MFSILFYAVLNNNSWIFKPIIFKSTNLRVSFLIRSRSAYSVHIHLFLNSDRIRTTVNVLGDSFGAGIVQHLSRHELQTSHSYVEDGFPNGDSIGKRSDLQTDDEPGSTVVVNSETQL